MTEIKTEAQTGVKAQDPQIHRDQLITAIAGWIAPLGYEVVHIEVQTHRQKILRLYIERNDGEIGIQDCVAVSRALDAPFETSPEIDAIFHGASYELEVSSPGVDRPLRTERDYARYAGKEARIHVFRPLTAEELGNDEYQRRNPKQKNFVGTLLGVRPGGVALKITEAKGAEVTIPLALVSKANLEPKFEITKPKAED